MSIYIDRKYILLLSPKLEQFKQKNSNLFTFRCCYCGDSEKNKTKTRGYVYLKGDSYFYRCHNCEIGTTLKKLIGFLDPFLEKEYIMENFKESHSNDNLKYYKPPVFKKYKPPEIITPTLDLPTIKSLSDNHIAKQYILNRQIPSHALDLLYYAEDFKTFTESVSDKVLDRTSPRIVIPFFSTEGKLIAFQGRALTSDSMRYITVKIDRDVEKLFGMERINPELPILVCEGPLDSLFLQNAIATADSNLAAATKVYDKDKLILIPDNEPRNENIVQNIERFINSGFSVCLFPESNKEKDINEMILSGLTKDDISDMISKYTYTGLRVKIEFAKWRKI